MSVPELGSSSANSRGPLTSLLGLAMIVAPIALLASTLISAAANGIGDDDTGGIVQVWAFAGFMPVVVGLVRLIEPRSPRGAALLLLLGSLAVAGGVGYGISGIVIDIDGFDLNETTDGLAGPLALQVPGALFPLSLVLAGFLLARGGTFPRWSPFAIIAGAVLFPITRIGAIGPVAPVADVLLIAGLAPLGLALLRNRSEAVTNAAEEAPAIA